MDDFDIARFLRGLPRVASKDVPSDDCKCPICQITYLEDDPESGYTEHPIMLPCNHTVGRHCLTMWLKPAPGGNANTCPLCRHKLFEPWSTPTESDTSQQDGETDYNEPENDYTRHIATTSATGYALGPYLGHIQDVNERPLELPRIAAYRRAVSLHEANLYAHLLGRVPGIELPLDPGHLLDYDQDEALFEYLQDYCEAFRGVCLNEEYREESERTMIGNRLDDYAIWSRLRDQGIYWSEKDVYEGTGCWVSRDGDVLYPRENEYDPDLLETLLHGGVLSSPVANRGSQNQGRVSHYRIFKELIDRGLTWNPRHQNWVLRSGEVMLASNSDRGEQATSRQQHRLRVIDTGSVISDQTSPPQNPRNRYRLWDGRHPGWPHEEEEDEDMSGSTMDIETGYEDSVRPRR